MEADGVTLVENTTSSKVQKRFIEETELTHWQMLMWRPVLAGKVSSFTEIRDTWTLDELLDVCEMLDLIEDMEEEQTPKQ